MTVARATFLLLLGGSMALAVVYLRTEQTRVAAHVQRLEDQRICLRQRSWAMQMEIARLKTPEQIADRVERLQLQVFAPYEAPFGRRETGLAKAR